MQLYIALARTTVLAIAPFALAALNGAGTVEVPQRGVRKTWCQGCEGSPRKADSRRHEDLPANVQDIIDRSYSAPPEIAADALLRAVETNAVTQPKKVKDLIETAYQFAMRAPDDVSEVLIPATNVDSEPGYHAFAMDLHLDRISLQARAVRDLLAVNPPSARSMFERIVMPSLPTLTCRDRLVYDPSAYYRAALAVFERGFTPAERNRGEDAEFVRSVVSRATDHSQLPPVLRFIRAVHPNQELLPALLNELASALRSMPADDRSFSQTFSVLYDPLRYLVQQSAALDVPSSGFLTAVRSYVKRGLTGARCADTVAALNQRPPKGVRVVFISDGVPGDVAVLNSLFAAAGVPVLKAADVAPAKVLPAPKSRWFWQAEPARQLYETLRRLYNADPAFRNSERWEVQADQLLASVDDWQAKAGGSEEDYLTQKTYLYGRLLEMLPASDPLFNTALGYLITFLENQSVPGEARGIWLWHVHRLLGDLAGKQTGKWASVAKAMHESANPALSFYSEVLTAFPQH